MAPRRTFTGPTAPSLVVETDVPGAGLSQTLTRAARRAGPTPISCFVNLRETETDCEQPVLLTDRPRAREAEALAQPQHGLEALDRASGCGEGLKAPDPRHGPLDPEVIALDPLLQVLGHVVDRILRQEPVFPALST